MNDRLSAEERGAWWWLLLHDRDTLRARLAYFTVCKVKHRWEYDMDWEPDAHAYNPGSAHRLCRRCQTFEWCAAEQVEAHRWGNR